MARTSRSPAWRCAALTWWSGARWGRGRGCAFTSSMSGLRGDQRTDVGVDERTWELMTEGNLFHGQGVIFTPDLSYKRQVAAADPLRSRPAADIHRPDNVADINEYRERHARITTPRGTSRAFAGQREQEEARRNRRAARARQAQGPRTRARPAPMRGVSRSSTHMRSIARSTSRCRSVIPLGDA